ncbi:hypothetical protein GGD38_002729 [Chitinophagaceae bacterium OAS944]|uniref:hypothetical protein n=1 Tax=Niastella sp. OAS944 TaxID=2664089 RepID=UPI0035C86865|nr:hypothetical protein [Chitinophagaceae bacterium OAS944]
MVSALAIFTGHDGNDMPARYSYEYRGTRLTYEYPTLCVRKFSDGELDNSSNPFAQVIVVARIRLKEGKVSEDELLNLKIQAARRLFAKGFEPAKVRSIFNFLRNYVLFEKPETNRKFDNQIKETDKAGIMDTLEYVRMEGKEEGLAEARRNAVVALLANTEFSIEKIAGILEVSIAFVIKVNDESKVRK